MKADVCSLSVERVDTKYLSDEDLITINNVTQDMWAGESWLGELSKCPLCEKILSKEDVFGYLPKEQFSNTVARIIMDENVTHIHCPDCGENTDFIYGSDNIEKIRKRLKESVSFLVVCRNELGDLVGYMDGYVDSLKIIFDQELAYHYSDIGFQSVCDRVDSILGGWSHAMSFISFSSMGLLEKYANFFTIFKMFNTFFETIPDLYLQTPGITELDRNNNIYSVHKTMGCKPIWMADMDEYRNRITHIGKGYESDIVVYGTPIKDFRENFSMGVREFLRAYRKNR